MVDVNESRILYESFCAIAESYTSIIYLDATDLKVHAIRLDDFSKRYEEELSASPFMPTILERYARENVYREDRDRLMRFADYEYVSNKLKSENPIFYIYRAIHNDSIVYYRLKIVPIEDGRKIVYGFENFDKQFRLQLRMNSEKELQMMLVKGLSREYMSVWYLDGKSQRVTLIQNNGKESENAIPVSIGKTVVDYHFSLQKYYGDFTEPEEFERMMRETAYDTVVERTTEDDLYSINYIRINPDGSRSHFQTVYAKIMDEAGIANFIIGYRNIDKTINEENRQL